MDIANDLHLDRKYPEDKATLQAFLETLVSDLDWSEDDPKEAGYKAAKLRRYHVNLKNTYTKEDKAILNEAITSQTQSTQLQSGPLALGGPLEVNIKIECQEWIDLQKLAKVLISGQQKLVKTVSDFQTVKFQLAQIKHETCHVLKHVCAWLCCV